MGLTDPFERFKYFPHARIEAVTLPNPRRINITLTQLLWNGTQGTYGSPHTIVFYDVQQDDAVHLLVYHLPEKEIAAVKIHPNKVSTHQNIYTHIIFERTGIECTIRSRAIAITPYQLKAPIDTATPEAIITWLTQEMQFVFEARKNVRTARARVVLQQLGERTSHLPAADKQILAHIVQSWLSSKIIGAYTLPRRDDLHRLLEDMVGTIDGILSE